MSRAFTAKTKLDSFDTIQVTPTVVPGAADQGAPGNVKKAIVLLHGFGADNQDLASLAEYVGSSAGVSWFFPNGPHSVPIGPHTSGRAWFPLRLAELEEKGIDFTQVLPDGMDRAANSILKAIEGLRSKHGLNWNQIVLGGFSQGAMMAVEVALRAPEAPAGVTIFSGSLVNEPLLKTLGPQKSGLKFFQSHGAQDFMLPFDLAEKLERNLSEAGWDGMLYGFRGGHEIPPAVLREWQSWLKSLGF
jgi:phospholipase/carboxylesterase